MSWKKRCSYKQLFWKFPGEIFSQNPWNISLMKFVFSKVPQSRSPKFLPKKGTSEKYNFHKFLYKVKTSGNATESCRLLACHFTKNGLPHRYFQGFWLQISEHLFSRTPLKWLLLHRHIQDLAKHLRWSFFVNIINGLKLLTIFTKKVHLRCFTRFCVRLCSEVTSSIYQKYKFKIYCNSFWRHCSVCDVVFARINEALCRLSDVRLSKNLELLCNFMFATNTKTIIYIT